MGSSIIAGVALLAGLWFTSAGQAADWPFFRGPSQNGVSIETDWEAKWPESGPRIAWKTNVGIGASSVVVVGDRVLTMGNTGTPGDKDVVVCLNARDGAALWQFDYACRFDKRDFDGGTTSTPTVDGDFVYAFSYDGQIHCLQLSDGKLVWRKQAVTDLGGQPADWKYACSPLIEGKLLILDIGGNGNSTIALDKTTGAKVWGSGDEKAGYSTPIPFTRGQTRGVLVFKGKSLVALNVADGKLLWSIPWETGWDINAASPIVIGDKFFVSSGFDKSRSALFQMTDKEPQQVWSNPKVRLKLGSGSVYQGHVYGVSEEGGQLVCADLKDGAIAWAEGGFGDSKMGEGTLTLAGGKLVVLSSTGELVIAEATPQGFRPVSRAKVLEKRCWVNPVMSNGRIYCRNNFGDIVCLDVRKQP